MKCRILDVGCGMGFLTRHLASQGHEVYGIDLSAKSLSIAKEKDAMHSVSVHYQQASAYDLPYVSDQFDIVCAMNLLECVEQPGRVVREAARVLKKGGYFFFHTFNRNWLSYFMIIKGVNWCFHHLPNNAHVYSLFIKPKELNKLCEAHHLQIQSLSGIFPQLNASFWKGIFLSQLDSHFRFVFTSSLSLGYTGYATRLYEDYIGLNLE